jgi:hypothetical protein
MPWRICSDFDRPVRAVIDVSRSSVSGSIKNVQRVFLPTFAVRFSDVDGTIYVVLAGSESRARATIARTLPWEIGDYRAPAVVPVMNTSLPWVLDARVKYTRP